MQEVNYLGKGTQDIAWSRVNAVIANKESRQSESMVDLSKGTRGTQMAGQGTQDP